MATRIIEYGNIGNTGPAFPIVPADHKITAQPALTATGTSAQSAAVDANTRFVLVQSDEAIYVNLGTSPTATTNDYRLAAAAEQYFSVDRNAGWKVAIRT